jgi:hypothetical protein
MKKDALKIPMPVRRTYPPEVKPAQIGELPFVYVPGYTPKISSKWHRRRCRARNASHWRLPNATVYRVACQIGYECGAHFAQYLKDQPDWSYYGVLRRILADIDFKDRSPNTRHLQISRSSRCSNNLATRNSSASSSIS